MSPRTMTSSDGTVRPRWGRTILIAVCASLLAFWIVASFKQYSNVENGALPAGAVVGGDYLAFDAAASAVQAGDAALIYDDAAFGRYLTQADPAGRDRALTWQYPPTYFLVVAGLAFVPFVLGYVLWTGGTALGYFASLRHLGVSKIAMFVVLASPSVFHAVITGQNGFLIAALFGIAALVPDKRPVLAGLAAALLTVKPQFGVLIPLAYLMGGQWRAFGTAAIGSLVLALLSTLLLGLEAWTAFFASLMEAGDRLHAAILPIHKMVSPYAWASYAGLPQAMALVVYGMFALMAAVAVAVVWRRVEAPDLRASVLCVAAFLVTPYAYYYELVILALPMTLMAGRAVQAGWLAGERLCFVLVFSLPILAPNAEPGTGFSWGFPIVLIAAACVLRRVWHHAPEAFARPRAGVPVLRPSLP